MALIIKGKMPTKCYDREHDEFCFMWGSRCNYCWSKRPSDCPIIGEIPDKHGDLIDRSALLKQFEHDTSRPTGYEVVTRIMNAPVVLERTT